MSRDDEDEDDDGAPKSIKEQLDKDYGATYDGDSMHDGKIWLRRRFVAGVMSDCPCCNQTVKRYARTITSGMLSSLRIIAGVGPSGITTPDLVKMAPNGTRDHAKLIGWHLVTKHPEDAARWVVTPLGLSFLAGACEIPRYVYWYNGLIVGRSDETMHISAFRTKRSFDLEEVLDPEAGTVDVVVPL